MDEGLVRRRMVARLDGQPLDLAPALERPQHAREVVVPVPQEVLHHVPRRARTQRPDRERRRPAEDLPLGQGTPGRPLGETPFGEVPQAALPVAPGHHDPALGHEDVEHLGDVASVGPAR